MKQILPCPANKTCRVCFRGASILENKITVVAHPMKSLFMTEKSSKISRWVFVLACFCITFSLQSPALYAWEPGPNPISSIDEAHKAVWKIQNFAPDVRFGSGKGHSTRTAFAIGERYFVTNFHVWNDLVNRSQALENPSHAKGS